MNVIIFDLETTFTYKKGQLPEIVEIGARKINLLHPQSVTEDIFQCYTHPEVSGRIGKSTRKFIGMKEKDIEKVISFKEGFRNFLDWIGNDYYLCSWGNDDKRLLIEHCVRYGIHLNWLTNYNDIQPMISTILSGRMQMSLKNALAIAELEKVGRLHSALIDAINTANLFIKYHNHIELKRNVPSDNYFYACSLYKECKKCRQVKYYQEYDQIRYCRNCNEN